MVQAAKTGRNVVINRQANADLLLYKLGDDEFFRLAVSGQVFDAVLAVKSKIAVNLVPSGGTDWTVNNAVSWAQQLNNQIKADLNGKFRIATPQANDFKNILLYFAPAYNMLVDTAPAGHHLHLRVQNRTGRNPAPRLQQHAGQTERLDLDRATPLRRVARPLTRTTGAKIMTLNP